MKRNRALAATKELLRGRGFTAHGWALLMTDGGMLCTKCVRAEWSQIAQYTLWKQPNSGWSAECPVSLDVDSCTLCDHCGDVIPSAYCCFADGDPSEYCELHTDRSGYVEP